MFVGHLAVGLAGKRFAPETSLGTLLFAALLPDLLWVVFLFSGIEHARIEPGITAANALDLWDYPLSHSLLTGALWAALFAGIYYAWRRTPRGAWVIFAAVLSHWLLDFLSHRPDMPLAPGVHRYFGLGLWNSIPATYLVEGLLWLLGIVVYARSTRATGRAGLYVFWAMIALLTALWVPSVGGPPPPDVRAIAFVNMALSIVLFAWAYWIDRVRPVPGQP